MTAGHACDLSAARHAQHRLVSSPDGQIRVLGWLMDDHRAARHHIGPAGLSQLLAAAVALHRAAGLRLLADRLPGLTPNELAWVAQTLWPYLGAPPGAVDAVAVRPPAATTPT